MFGENCSHLSDWDNSWWNWFKNTEFHTSHLVIDYDNHELTLIPSDAKYSIYRFSVSTQRATMEEAALVLIKYFTSSLDNKRQNFSIPLIFGNGESIISGDYEYKTHPFSSLFTHCHYNIYPIT